MSPSTVPNVKRKWAIGGITIALFCILMVLAWGLIGTTRFEITPSWQMQQPLPDVFEHTETLSPIHRLRTTGWRVNRLQFAGQIALPQMQQAAKHWQLRFVKFDPGNDDHTSISSWGEQLQLPSGVVEKVTTDELQYFYGIIMRDSGDWNITIYYDPDTLWCIGRIDRIY